MSRVKEALRQMSEACGELNAHRKKGNFFAATLAKVDAEHENLCDAVKVISEHIADLEAENTALRRETSRLVSGTETDMVEDGLSGLELLAARCGKSVSRLVLDIEHARGEEPKTRLLALADTHDVPRAGLWEEYEEEAGDDVSDVTPKAEGKSDHEPVCTACAAARETP